MLNIKGAFVIVGDAAPVAIILNDSALALYRDRVDSVGVEKANRYQFGHTARVALPCTRECMEFVALNFVGPFQTEVRGLCAAIAIGRPIGNGKDLTEGGTKVRAPSPGPRKPAPAAVAAVGAQS